MWVPAGISSPSIEAPTAGTRLCVQLDQEQTNGRQKDAHDMCSPPDRSLKPLNKTTDFWHKSAGAA